MGYSSFLFFIGCAAGREASEVRGGESKGRGRAQRGVRLGGTETSR